MKTYVLKAVFLLAGLVLAFALAAADAPKGPREDDIPIVDDPLTSLSETIDIGRQFGTPPCVSRKSGRTMIDVVRPDARRILVHRFDGDWRELDAVVRYLRRLLIAVPEGGKLSPSANWAEVRPVEILASIEFADGQRRPLHLANGYAHFQDAAGCEWWARYLGPDKRRWVIRR